MFNMSEIQVIYFDLGKVLLNFEWDLVLQGLSPYWKGTRDDLIQFIQKDDSFHRFERGEISPEDFFPPLIEYTSFTGDVDQLLYIWANIFNPMDENIKIAHELAEKYPLGLISNINEIHCDFVESRYDFLGIFTSKTYSHLVGSRKPELDIYKSALESFSVEPQHTIFIDDMATNIEAAKDIGMNVIHFQPGTDLRKELQALNINI